MDRKDRAKRRISRKLLRKQNAAWKWIQNAPNGTPRGIKRSTRGAGGHPSGQITEGSGGAETPGSGGGGGGGRHPATNHFGERGTPRTPTYSAVSGNPTPTPTTTTTSTTTNPGDVALGDTGDETPEHTGVGT